MGLTVAIALQAALLATGGDTYADAHQRTTEKGCPLVVMVGAVWCSACQEMKISVIPEIRRQGILQKVAFAEVDLDEDRELGKELTEGGPIPQLVLYRNTPLGWRQTRLVGGKDVRTVKQFIAEAIAAQEADALTAHSAGKDPARR